MTAKFSKNMGTYRITLTRKEAEIVAYSGTTFSILLTALRAFKESDEFTIYGSKYEVEKALAK